MVTDMPSNVRIHRRTHSVSGPPSVHSVMKDIACCCNMNKIHQFYMTIMALRRNPQRLCNKEKSPTDPVHIGEIQERQIVNRIPASRVPASLQLIARHQVQNNAHEPFRFFGLPREVRDHVYSYLVVRCGRKTPIIEAKAILRNQKKRIAAERTRIRLNQKRAQSGRRPITPREAVTEPTLHLNILQASKALHYEASGYMYENNWFAISLDNFPVTTIDTPLGWDFPRIAKLQLELQLKDAQRMNTHIDWATFFTAFPRIRFLRIIPTFHPRYYDWAQAELNEWSTAHFIFRAFFRELLASVPERIVLKLGPSRDWRQDMQLEGKAPVSTRLLKEMYLEMGMKSTLHAGSYGYLAVNRIVDGEELGYHA